MALIKINGQMTTSTATAEDVQSVTDLDSLHDVYVNGSLADNDLLQYDTGLNNWVNTDQPTLSNILADATNHLLIKGKTMLAVDVNSLPGNQQNNPVTAEFLKIADNNTRRMRILLGTQNSSGDKHYDISLDSRFLNNEKRFRITAPNDIDAGPPLLLSECLADVTSGLKQHRIYGVIDQSDVQSDTQPNSMFLRANANGEIIHNFMTAVLNHGATSVPDGSSDTFTFTALDDTMSQPAAVGQLLAVYNSDDDFNQMQMRVRRHDYSNNETIGINFEKAYTTVPFQFPSYDLNLGPLPVNPVAGMMVFNTDTNKMAFHNGTTWADL